MSAKGGVNVNLDLNMAPLLYDRLVACCTALGLTRHKLVIFALKREVTQIEARLAGHGGCDTSAKAKVNVNLHMMPLLYDRLHACCAARGLGRRDFIAFAVEREVSQIEARLKRRAREELAHREAHANLMNPRPSGRGNATPPNQPTPQAMASTVASQSLFQPNSPIT